VPTICRHDWWKSRTERSICPRCAPVEASGTSWASVARRLRVNETTLRNWVHAHLAEQERAANPLAVKESEFEELRRLRREVKELQVEKEILREAASFFARETIRSAASGSSPSTETPTASSGFAELLESPDPASTPLKRNERCLKGRRPTSS
jgi:transposase